MRIDWRELIERCPELAELRADAASIAEQEQRPWYERWLPGSRIFREAIDRAAWRLGAPPEDVWSVALAGLVDAYRTAKERLRRKGRNPRLAAARLSVNQ